ncbi:MAG: hypothetical protein IJ955_05435 [Oscillospiraceae bacterium]|nr:hypothetical protein [Oscillospiraceae bacterium]
MRIELANLLRRCRSCGGRSFSVRRFWRAWRRVQIRSALATQARHTERKAGGDRLLPVQRQRGKRFAISSRACRLER